MNHLKIFTLLLAALVGLLASCSSNPASPDVSDSVEALQPNTTAPASSATAVAGNPRLVRNADAVVYVYGQNLYYDTIVGPDLPPKGKFQLLEMEGPTGLQTEFGPGDQGYRGGRWWVDVNGNGMMDDGVYFSCPLLGPGRETP